MANSYTKLDQALKDLVEAYTALEEELDEKFGEDEEAYSSALVEALETSVESAIDDQDSSTSAFATMLSNLTESVELLDPSAFEGESEEEDEDVDIEDVDYDELDEDEDEDDGDDDYDDE